MIFKVEDCTNIFIFGGGHGIGLGLIKEFLTQYPSAKVFTTYRIDSKSLGLRAVEKDFRERLEIFKLDPTCEHEVEELSLEMERRSINFNLVINCVGFLHDETYAPEKSLKEIKKDHLLKSIEVNSLPTLFIAKNFINLFPKKDPSCFTTISAKVGSIQDNRMGGWYSYRASKAALNMLIKNIAIEFERKRVPCNVISYHPGTTETELSKPFIGNTKYQIHSVEEAAKNLINAIDNTELSKTGSFLSWDNSSIPW